MRPGVWSPPCRPLSCPRLRPVPAHSSRRRQSWSSSWAKPPRPRSRCGGDTQPLRPLHRSRQPCAAGSVKVTDKGVVAPYLRLIAALVARVARQIVSWQVPGSVLVEHHCCRESTCYYSRLIVEFAASTIAVRICFPTYTVTCFLYHPTPNAAIASLIEGCAIAGGGCREGAEAGSGQCSSGGRQRRRHGRAALAAGARVQLPVGFPVGVQLRRPPRWVAAYPLHHPSRVCLVVPLALP